MICSVLKRAIPHVQQETAAGATEAADETQEKALSPARVLPADLEDSIDDIDEE